MYDPSSSKSHSATFTLPEFRKSCWVPSCANIENINYSKTFYPLPTSSLLREIWLARAGRPVGLSTDKIYFCEEHFRHEDLLSYALRGTTFMPCYKMSQVICRMCMSIVPEAEPYHVLSNTIPTDIPTELKNTLKLAILITPEPLQNIVKFCMPELTIQTDPIPLICQNCFKRLWKFFLFKTTCIEVDKSLRGDLPVATYGKMVLCRACPQTFGTNFIILVEQTNLGMFLMNMFLTKYSSKIVPLRLCKSCYEILEDLLEFQLNCHTVEEKMKRHIALTQNQPIIRTQALSSSESAHTSIWDTRDIYSNERPQIGDITDDSSVSTNGNIFIMWKRVEFIKAMIKHGLPLRYKVDRDLKDEIWRKISEELQTKGVICNIVGLKSVWLTMMADIQKALNRNQSLNESQSLMIQYLKVDEQAGHLSRNNIYENATVGSTLDLDNGRDHLESQPCPQTQLPLFVEGNISTSVDRYEQETHSDPKINLQILQKNASSARNVTIQPTINFDSYQNFRTLAHNETIANPSIDEMIKSSDNKKIFSSTQGNDRSENYSIGTSVSTKSRKANKLSNILKPDINKIKIPIPEIVNMPINNITALSSVSGNNSRKSEMETGDIIFSNEEQLDLLEIMKVEYKLYLEEVGKVYTKLPFKEILSRIIKRYKKYEKYSFITIYNCWKSMKKSSLECKNDCMKTALQQEILEFLEFQRQHSQKKVRSKMLKTKRSNFSYKKSNDQDKLDLVEAVQREYDALREDEFSVRSIWKKLIENVHRKGFKCWSFEKILSLWGRLKISAVVHEKNSGDLVDEKVWKLLQQYNMDKKRIRNNTESKNVSGNQDKINIKNNIRQDKSDNQTDRELVNIDVDLNKNNVDLAHSVNIQNERVITKEQQAQKGQDFVNPSSKTNVKLDKRKFNMGRSSAKETVYELSLKRKLHFLNEIEQEYDKTPAPWKDILNRLYKKQYKCWDKTKIISVWKQLKASSRAHEEKDADIADKKTWDLLQKYSKAQNKLTNSNKSSGREFSTIKHTREYLGKEEMPQMIDVNKKSDGKKFHKFSEVEKMSLFKNIKKEYYTMVNNKEQNLSRPWKTVIHRVQEKYYKNILSESKVLSEWSKIRKSAALHENTSSMSQVDWKVVRLMKFANKMKDFKTNSKKKIRIKFSRIEKSYSRTKKLATFQIMETIK